MHGSQEESFDVFFAQVSLTVMDFFDTIAKAKKLIRESIAQNFKQVSLTKRFFIFGNGI